MQAMLVATDADEAAILSLVLKRTGLAVTTAPTLGLAMQKWVEHPADLIVLALREPDPQEQVWQVRTQAVAPLAMVVSPLDEDLHCTLLENGADLVVPRPFSARLLIAQLRVLLRRAAGMALPGLPRLSVAGLALDPANRTVTVENRPPRRLTHLEFRLLYTLMLHRGQVLPAETIVDQVWGYANPGDRELVRGLISRLRAKVEHNPRKPRYILTVPGVGYLFQAEED